MSSKRTIKYYGRAMGYSLVLACEDINVTRTFNDNYDFALELEEELRQDKEYQFLYEDLSGKSDEYWTPYFIGFKKGVVDGLKLQGIKHDNSHLNKTQNTIIIKKMYRFMKTFIMDRQKKDHNKKIKLDFDSEKNLLMVTNFTLILKLFRLKSIEFMFSTGVDVSKYIVNSDVFKGAIRNIMADSPYSSYIDSYLIQYVGTQQIPYSMLATFKGNQPISGHKREEQSETKIEKISNISSIKKDILSRQDEKFYEELDEHIIDKDEDEE